MLLGSMFFLGISNLFFQKSSLTIGAFPTTVWYYIIGTIITLLAYVFNFNNEKLLVPIHDLKWVALISLCISLSVYLFSRAVETVPVSIGASIRSMSFVVTILITLILGETDWDVKKGVGVLCALAAVYCLK